ncbi:MAG: DUF3426 domain-containing protein [Glaciimonas sp.]|nr:DUF3426 domain-containing protein [Glaciimonas sp.]
MALATQCPHCQTTFRVANDQLKLRAGLVRCGSCREVFNGIEHLVRPANAEISASAEGQHSNAVSSAASSNPAALLPPQNRPPVSNTVTAAIISSTMQANSVVVAMPEKNIAALLTAQSTTQSHIPTPDVSPEAEAKKAALIASLDAAAATSLETPNTLITAHEPKVWHRAPSQMETPLPEIQLQEDESDDDDNVVGNDDNDPDQDPLQRMTLFQVATHYRDKEGQPHTKEDTTTTEDDEELDRLIDELQNRPWRQSQKIDPNKPYSSSSYVPSGAVNVAYGDIRHEPNFSSNANLSNADKNAVAMKLADEKSVFEEPEFIQQAIRKQRFGDKVHTIMLAGSALLLIAAIAQISFTFRDQLAARVPALKPVLVKMCGVLNCTVGLPMKIDAISIESNELQAISANQNSAEQNQFALNLLMRNTGSTVLAWPNVELTLKDVNDKAQVRRVFTPHDYLPAITDTAQGFAHNTEQTVKLAFELHHLKASGYSVYLFYP